MTQDHLQLEVRNRVARITLSRPDVHNAFDDALIARLTAAANDLDADPGVRVVVLGSEGKSFSAGADLGWMKRMADYSEEENLADARAMARMFETLEALSKPLIGRVQGAALGGGVGLVAVCDIVVAAVGSLFGFTEVRLGILPAVISPFVVRKVGLSAARERFLTGERFGPEEAKRIGLVHRVASPEDLDAEIEKVVEALLAGGPEAQRRIKDLLGSGFPPDPPALRELTAGTIAAARVSAEGQEGIRSFLDRRAPSWREDG